MVLILLFLHAFEIPEHLNHKFLETFSDAVKEQLLNKYTMHLKGIF